MFSTRAGGLLLPWPASPILAVLLALWLASVLPVPALAQAAAPSQTAPVHSSVSDTVAPDLPPARFSSIQGPVALERDARVLAPAVDMPLLAGDRVRTEAGRARIQFGAGSSLELAPHSDVDLRGDAFVQLLGGALQIVLVSRTACTQPDVWCLSYRIDSAPGSVVLHAAGEYHIALQVVSGEPRLELSVGQGSATLQNGRGTVIVGAGSHAWTTADLPPAAPTSNDTIAAASARPWPGEDRTVRRDSTPSASPVPAELADYGSELDRAGAWRTDPTLGRVWYPRVGADWAPYSTGDWSFVASFGWVWIGAERWSWPTHHYGRWGIDGRGWFWIPGSHWAPGWVAWAYAPGYVSWCPLGANDEAVVAPGSARHGGGWSGVPAERFARNTVSLRAAVDRSLPLGVPRSLVAGPPPGLARGAAPLSLPLLGPEFGRPATSVPRPLEGGRITSRVGSSGGPPAPGASVPTAGAGVPRFPPVPPATLSPTPVQRSGR